MADNTAPIENLSPVQRFVADILPPSKRDEITIALPAHVSIARFERNLANAIMREPKIMNVDPRIVFREVAKIAALGLVLDPQLGEAWLIVDGRGDIQARVGYRGLIKLARQSGEIENPYAMDICENDVVDITQGTNREILHKPDYTKDRAKPVAYYAVVGFKEGKPDFEVMSLAEIYKIRDRSDAYRAFKAGKIKSTPWATDEGEMCKKTVLRRLLKRCPMSPELADLLAREDELDDRDMRDVTPQPAGITGVQQRLLERRSVAPIDMNQHVERELAPVNHDPETGEISEVRDGNSPVVADDPAAARSPGDKTAAGSPLTWREQGRAAYHADMDRTDCPADATKDQKTEWLAGYEEAMAEAEGDDFPGDRK